MTYVAIILVLALVYAWSEVYWLRERYKRLHQRFTEVCKQRDECLQDLNAIFNGEE